MVLTASRPPAAQLLYDLGLEADDDLVLPGGPPASPQANFPTSWPPLCPPSRPPNDKKQLSTPPTALYAPLPLRLTAKPHVTIAAAARTKVVIPSATGKTLAADVVSQFLIGPQDMETIYMSDDPYGRSFEITLDLRKWDLTTH